MSRIAGIIPARYASTRFPGKPLALIGNKPMIQHVYERSHQCSGFERLIVATDDQRIFDAVKAFGGEVMMTSEHHASGTDRCAEVLDQLDAGIDYLVNIQGDEPLISPEQLNDLLRLLDGKTEIASQYRILRHTEEIFSANQVKVVCNSAGEALYFSREPIPHQRGAERAEWIRQFSFKGHVGLYAYRCDILRQISQLAPSSLEKAESLEQLRWIENGFRIRMCETTFQSIGVDSPEDLEKVRQLL